MIITESDGSELEYVRQYIPYAPEDYCLIIDTLKDHDILTLFDRDIDAYDHMLYVKERVCHGTDCVVYIDLNMLLNILSVARVDHGRADTFVKLGSAFILFCKISQIDIEPFYALNESPKQAKEELLLMQRIENAYEELLLRILRGEILFIPETLLPKINPTKISDDAFSISLKGSHITRTALTKFAAICKSKSLPEKKVEALILWMHEQYLHEHTVAHMAIYQLSPNAKSPILKNTQSTNLAKILRSIENALGDLLLLRYWVKGSVENQDNQLILLATADKSLLDVSRLVLHSTCCEVKMKESFKSRLIELWGSEKGSQLFEFYTTIKNNTKSAHRLYNQRGFNPHDEKHKQKVNLELKQTL